MGFSKGFEQALGVSRDEVLEGMQTIVHFTSNPHPSYSKERIAAEKDRIDRMVQARTGVSLDEILAQREKLERDLNSQPNPVQAGIRSGIPRLLRRSEES